MIYIRLFHGRKGPKQDMQDWGFNGPVLGPFDWIHGVYDSVGNKDGEQIEIPYHEDMLH